MKKPYDLVVIGTGTAAMSVAVQVRSAGWQVAIVDYRAFGGTCALRGCDPKKMLVGGASAVDHVRRMQGKGVTGHVCIDWQRLMAFKHSYTDPVPQSIEQRLKEKGIDSYHGRARFVGKNAVQIGGETLEAKHILIASGAKPSKLNLPGEEHLMDSEGFLSMETLPRRIVLVGGGYIAAEFSHVAARAGASITILQRADRLLTEFDADLVRWLMDAFTAHGINVELNTTVERIEKSTAGYRIFKSTAGKQSMIEADLVVHAAGRTPELEELDLATAGIHTQNGLLKLNSYMQSVSNPCVYAAGDAARLGPPLTPVAGQDAKIVASNLLHGNQQTPNYAAVPSVAFTIPPIAAVGLTEEQARTKGIQFRMQSAQASAWYTARQQAEPVYGYKVLIDQKTDRIVGAHLVGPNVAEVINVFALAMRHGLTALNLRSTLFAYPTGASDISSML